MSDLGAAAGQETSSDERRRWERRYREREERDPATHGPMPAPPAPLARMVGVLPDEGSAVDLAGGDGGGGLFLAGRGLQTTVVDIATGALQRATTFAAAAELELRTVEADLADRPLGEVLDAIEVPAPDVVTCCHYLDRTLLASVGRDLPPGSRFAVSIATTTDLRPDDARSARFLLEPGRLADLVVGGGRARLRVLHRREGWAWGRHRAELAVEAIDRGGGAR